MPRFLLVALGLLAMTFAACTDDPAAPAEDPWLLAVDEVPETALVGDTIEVEVLFTLSDMPFAGGTVRLTVTEGTLALRHADGSSGGVSGGPGTAFNGSTDNDGMLRVAVLPTGDPGPRGIRVDALFLDDDPVATAEIQFSAEAPPAQTGR